jgi:hypothetical protein
MKQALCHLVAVLCVLMLIASAASCMDIVRHRQPSCSHCTQHQPVDQQTSICRDAHHQPSATATATVIERSAQISSAETSAVPINTVALLSPPEQLIWPPPFPLRLTLRI